MNQGKNPEQKTLLVWKKLMGKNLNKNWHISAVLKRVRSVIQHHSYVYLFFGKEQYMCWGSRTVASSSRLLSDY